MVSIMILLVIDFLEKSGLFLMYKVKNIGYCLLIKNIDIICFLLYIEGLIILFYFWVLFK